MPADFVTDSKRSFRTFWYTLAIVNACLVASGIILASRYQAPAAIAAPIVLAFLQQVSVYLVPGFPQVRAALESRFTPRRLAALLAAFSIGPYLIYAIPTGVFSLLGLAKLSTLVGVICLPFLVATSSDKRLGWQDIVVLLALAYPMISGLSPMFREIYRSPIPEVARLDFLGKMMLVPLGATVFLSIRKLSATGFRLAVSANDVKAGVNNYLLFLPIGIPLALGTGFIRWSPKAIDQWTHVPELLGNTLGVYAFLALGEELYFRGILQNLLTRHLGSAPTAQVIASIFYALSHISSRHFPNWEYAAVTLILGWFCGRAYVQTQSIVAAAVTHTLVVVSLRFLFE